MNFIVNAISAVYKLLWGDLIAIPLPGGGSLGISLLVLLLIILRCVWVSRRARSHMSAYIAMGIAGMLMIQTIINVAMTLYIGPVIGLTLPFISYGGSSTLTLFIAMGLVSGIKMRPLPSWLKDRSQL